MDWRTTIRSIHVKILPFLHIKVPICFRTRFTTVASVNGRRTHALSNPIVNANWDRIETGGDRRWRFKGHQHEQFQAKFVQHEQFQAKFGQEEQFQADLGRRSSARPSWAGGGAACSPTR